MSTRIGYSEILRAWAIYPGLGFWSLMTLRSHSSTCSCFSNSSRRIWALISATWVTRSSSCLRTCPSEVVRDHLSWIVLLLKGSQMAGILLLECRKSHRVDRSRTSSTVAAWTNQTFTHPNRTSWTTFPTLITTCRSRQKTWRTYRMTRINRCKAAHSSTVTTQARQSSHLVLTRLW